ncbi:MULTISPECIES: GntR family transcriptional regulator [unclassified Virgibacillus]|uniref:GntR family transcriptional regulator n=1 Tax=unclassified Virgibacillus TaxID=2620237 RepID=UPI0024DE0896|nr:GntR family transcriptional regulator [Virgibacillus sp. LDC-1]
MNLDINSTKPIYIQIAEWIENEILVGHFKTEEKVFSQYKLAEVFNINPATAAKGLNLLSDEGILYTKRGLGKFVTADAKHIIQQKRKNGTLKGLILDSVREAKRLKVSEQELMEMITKAHKEIEGDEA